MPLGWSGSHNVTLARASTPLVWNRKIRGIYKCRISLTSSSCRVIGRYVRFALYGRCVLWNDVSIFCPTFLSHESQLKLLVGGKRLIVANSTRSLSFYQGRCCRIASVRLIECAGTLGTQLTVCPTSTYRVVSI